MDQQEAQTDSDRDQAAGQRQFGSKGVDDVEHEPLQEQHALPPVHLVVVHGAHVGHHQGVVLAATVGLRKHVGGGGARGYVRKLSCYESSMELAQ